MKKNNIWNFWASRYHKLWVQKVSLKPTRQAVVDELKTILKKDKAYQILDVGCGTGQLISDIKSHFKGYNITITGIDYAEKMIQVARSQHDDVKLINVAVEDYQVPSCIYDIVICTHSFPYYQNKSNIAHRFSQWLKPSGTLILAQASINNIYDRIVMTFVELTTTAAEYLSINKIKSLFINHFTVQHEQIIKVIFFMPTISLIVFTRKQIDENTTR